MRTEKGLLQYFQACTRESNAHKVFWFGLRPPAEAEPEFRLGFDCEDGLGAMSDGRKEVLAIVPLGGSGRDLAGDG